MLKKLLHIRTQCALIAITFDICDFISNNDGLFSFSSIEDLSCQFNVMLIGPVYISQTTVMDHPNMIYIHNVILHIHGPL